ncbi:MAG: pyridoxamine 5'-phosphate oxidase [Akkermansiaceae bacterium]
MQKPSLADLRENYTKSGLDVIDVHPDPFTQFQNWMHLAIATEIVDPNAMTLATADAHGIPSSRIVLLKHYDDNGFCFFTNYTSHKGKDIAQNPHAAITLHWKELERQICIRGKVVKTTRQESENYFHMRPHSSQIGATASAQSHPLADRATLEKREQELLLQYPQGTTVPLPEFWGGYRLIPDYIEFWQGRPSRLHDRIIYTRKLTSDTPQDWKLQRLCP